MKKIFLCLVLGLSLAMVSPVVTMAQTAPAAVSQEQSTMGQEVPTFRSPSSFGYESPVGDISVTGFISRLISFALGIVGAILLATFVYGGGSWMIAGGDAKKVEAAKATLKNAVIGMVIVALSYTIVTAVFSLGNAAIQGAPATPTPTTTAQ